MIELPVGGHKKLTVSFVDAAGNPTIVGVPTDAPVWAAPDPALATLDEATGTLTATGAAGASGPIGLTVGTLMWSGTISITAGPASGVVVTAE